MTASHPLEPRRGGHGAELCEGEARAAAGAQRSEHRQRARWLVTLRRSFPISGKRTCRGGVSGEVFIDRITASGRYLARG